MGWFSCCLVGTSERISRHDEGVGDIVEREDQTQNMRTLSVMF